MFAAIRRASSLVSSLAADRRPRLILEIDIGELLTVVVAHDKAGFQFVDGPRRREAAHGHLLLRAYAVTRQVAWAWRSTSRYADQLRDGSARILDLLLLAILAALRGRKICRFRGPTRVRHSEQNLPPNPRIVL
jgi:hypothetical protein